MVEINWRGDLAIKIARDAVMKALNNGANAILTEAIDEAPVKTGTLRRSGMVTAGALPSNSLSLYKDAKSGIEAFADEYSNDPVVYVSFNTPYAAAVHEGYDPHEITVDSAKVLATPASRWKGGVVHPYNSNQLPKYSKDGKYVIIGKRVRHPGYKGKKYLENPFKRNRAKVIKMTELAVKKALKETR